MTRQDRASGWTSGFFRPLLHRASSIRLGYCQVVRSVVVPGLAYFGPAWTRPDRARPCPGDILRRPVTWAFARRASSSCHRRPLRVVGLRVGSPLRRQTSGFFLLHWLLLLLLGARPSGLRRLTRHRQGPSDSPASSAGQAGRTGQAQIRPAFPSRPSSLPVIQACP